MHFFIFAKLWTYFSHFSFTSLIKIKTWALKLNNKNLFNYKIPSYCHVFYFHNIFAQLPAIIYLFITKVHAHIANSRQCLSAVHHDNINNIFPLSLIHSFIERKIESFGSLSFSFPRISGLSTYRNHMISMYSATTTLH